MNSIGWQSTLYYAYISYWQMLFYMHFHDNYVPPSPSWSWSYISWIYNYLCNLCLSPLKLWVWIPIMVKCTQYKIMWYKFFRSSTPVSSTNKTDHHDITEILLKVALSTITLTLNLWMMQLKIYFFLFFFQITELENLMKITRQMKGFDKNLENLLLIKGYGR